MWVAFMLAAYSAIANDSIQTIGTFIASNAHRKWYYLWLYMGGIFVITVTYSWLTYNGDVSYQRLANKGLNAAPEAFSFLQVFAPAILLILTRLRMPVSTSILLLSAFSTKSSSIVSILQKSFFGYFLAFVVAIAFWLLISSFFEKHKSKKPAAYWMPFQWITSGLLWSVWIMQDAANIAVVLPRSLGTGEFAFFTLFIFGGLGLLFYLKGDRIQSIVNEKTDVTDVRAATMVDFVYAILLYYLKWVSTIPISTTWVFIGLLGGRELAISLRMVAGPDKRQAVWHSLKLIRKDVLYAVIGLLVSLILAFSINEEMRRNLFSIFD
ncbi:MAG: hypothetical protein ACJASO_001431 [Cyclobacteriaceae bacterium]|jgi:hypothetical protein